MLPAVPGDVRHALGCAAESKTSAPGGPDRATEVGGAIHVLGDPLVATMRLGARVRVLIRLVRNPPCDPHRTHCFPHSAHVLICSVASISTNGPRVGAVDTRTPVRGKHLGRLPQQALLGRELDPRPNLINLGNRLNTQPRAAQEHRVRGRSRPFASRKAKTPR